jgi:hypothetical protein
MSIVICDFVGIYFEQKSARAIVRCFTGLPNSTTRAKAIERIYFICICLATSRHKTLLRNRYQGNIQMFFDEGDGF